MPKAKAKEYKIVWTIDVTADNPVEAAMGAREIQKDYFSQATVFEVKAKNGKTVVVDLEEFMEDNID